MALRVADAAFVLDLVMGPSPHDLNSLPKPDRSWREALDEGRQPRRAVWCPAPDGKPSDAEVVAVCEAALAELEGAGVKVEVRTEPLFADPIREYILLSGTMVSGELGEMTEDRKDMITPGLRYYLDLASEPQVADFVRAVETFRVMAIALAEVMDGADLLLTPTVAGQFPECGGKGHINGGATDAWVRHTYPYNLTRLPAGSVRAGFTAGGMPVGLQIVGHQHADVEVLQALAFCEQIFAPPVWPALS